MPHNKQAKKRLRQDDIKRLRNRSAKREIKTLTKNLQESVDENDEEAADEIYRLIVSKLDKAAVRNVYHKNTVARRKSQVAGIFNALKS